MTAIVNAKAVLDGFVLEDAVILLEGDRISAVAPAAALPVPEGAEVIDAKGLYVGPGLVDIHVHGGNGAMFSDDPGRAAEHFLSHGETSQLATLYYTLSREELIAAMDGIRRVMTEGAGRAIRGFYMEGPYMNPKYGASPEKNKWRGEIKPEDYRPLVDAAGKDARVWAVAPEREGIESFVAYAKEVNPAAVIAVGHSEATPAQVRALKQYGLTLETHCMNATGRPPCPAGTRSCGPDEACLMDRDMYAELICDSQGVHVPPDMIELILTVKGAGRVLLISDSYFSAEPSPAAFSHVTDLSFDANGDLSGSRLTLDVACQNLMKHTGCDVVLAFLLASRNPARAAGLFDEAGSLTPGKRADLIFVDEKFNVKAVVFGGELQKGTKLC